MKIKCLYGIFLSTTLLLTRQQNRSTDLFCYAPRKYWRKCVNFLVFPGLALAADQWRRVCAPPITPAIMIVGLIALASSTQSAEIQTEWIKPQEGYTEQLLGARIQSIETLPGDEGQRITLEIPRQSVQNESDIQEIIVTAQQPDKSELQINIPHEWVNDYQNDYYGLVLYIGKNKNVPFRIYLKGHERQ